MGKITMLSIHSALHLLNRMINGYAEPYVDFYKETDHYSFRHDDKLKMRHARTNVLKFIYFHGLGGNKCNLN